MEADSSINIPSHDQASKDISISGGSHKCNLLSFHLFPLLPPELRYQIWTCALSWPRNLFIKKSHWTKTPIHHIRHVPIYHTRGTNPPVLLHVCHESRLLAQEVYQRCFGYQSSCTSWPGIWIAPSMDVVEFDSWDFTELLQHDVLLAELQPIQNLVLRSVDYRANFLSTHLSAFAALTNLRILELVIWRDSTYGFDTFVKVILDLMRQVDRLPLRMWRRSMPVLRILDWGNGGMATLRRRPDGSMEVTNDGEEVFFSGCTSWWHRSWMKKNY